RATSYVAGIPLQSENILEVRNPYNNHLVGTVTLASAEDTQNAIKQALENKTALSRYERYAILDNVRRLLMERKEEFAQTICAEAGLAIREARYETGRAHDVLFFAAMECLKDDGQIFSCDISPQGKA